MTESKSVAYRLAIAHIEWWRGRFELPNPNGFTVRRLATSLPSDIMVEDDGIEPPTPLVRPVALPLGYSPWGMVEGQIRTAEPEGADLQSAALPLRYPSDIYGGG